MIRLPVRDREYHVDLDPRTILGVGLNYHDHIAEHRQVGVQGFTREVPTEPVLFAMTPNVLIGHGEPIVIPRFIADYGFENPRVDYEAELAFVVKDRCRNVPREEALEHVLGYVCMNDVSQRNFQRGDPSGWFRGKSLDTFGPVGPVLALREDIPDPQNLALECRLNGQVVQASNTRHMIFPVAELLAFISRNFTLMPGDLVSTGTPGGVGPIKHGDVVEIEIEGIGILRNPVQDEAQADAGPA